MSTIVPQASPMQHESAPAVVWLVYPGGPSGSRLHHVAADLESAKALCDAWLVPERHHYATEDEWQDINVKEARDRQWVRSLCCSECGEVICQTVTSARVWSRP